MSMATYVKESNTNSYINGLIRDYNSQLPSSISSSNRTNSGYGSYGSNSSRNDCNSGGGRMFHDPYSSSNCNINELYNGR
jgi:hypothetical protein